MNNLYVFIYAKENKIRVLNHDESLINKENLINDGWKHTATLDVCRFIEHLYNDCDNDQEIINEINDLSYYFNVPK